MKNLKKKNIGIGIVLFFVMISTLGCSFLKDNEAENAEDTNKEEQLAESTSTLMVDEAGSITLDEEYKEIIINVPGVKIENGSVDKIFVGEGAGKGELTLDNVESKELIVQAEDSLDLIVSGASEIQNFILEREDSSINLLVKDKSIIKNSRIYGNNQKIDLEGKFDSIEIAASNSQVDIKEALVETFSVSGAGSSIHFDKNSSIDSAIVLVDAEDNKIVFDGSVENTTIDGKNNTIDFNGKTDSVYVRENAENTTISVGKNSTVESFIAMLPVTLNRAGQINKIIADSSLKLKDKKNLAKTENKIEKSIKGIRPKKSMETVKLQKQGKTPKLTKSQVSGKLTKLPNSTKAGKNSQPKKPRLPVKPQGPKEPENPEKPAESEEPEEPDESEEEAEEPEKPEESEEEVEKPEEPEDSEEVIKDFNPLAKETLDKNLAFMYERLDNPSFGIGGGEWAILSLARAGYDVPEEYYDLYHDNTVKEVKRLMEKYGGKLNRNKGTEHSRLMLGFGALGMDIKDVAGYDIREKLADFNFVTRQGINGPIFALIALDTHDYEIPLVEAEDNQSSRQKFIDYILDKEISETAGWSLGGRNPDPDVTAMAIQGLTPYYEEQVEVREAVDRGLAYLSEAQNENGGYLSWGTENSESVVQVIVALTGLGIDPHNDARFIKNGHSAIDNLLTFAVEEGGFRHTQSGGENGMATEQGNYALVAYDRFIHNQTSLYDMSDVTLEAKALNNPKIKTIAEREMKEERKAEEKLETELESESEPKEVENAEPENKISQSASIKEEVQSGLEDDSSSKEEVEKEEGIDTTENSEKAEQILEETKSDNDQSGNDNDTNANTNTNTEREVELLEEIEMQ